MEKKGFCLSSDGWDRDQLFFRRGHSGAAPERTAPLKPLWPVLVGALALMIIGLILITAAGNAAAALGGLIFCFAGIGLLAIVAHHLGARHGVR